MSDWPEIRQTIAFDFDGVLHSYTSKWDGNAENIPDPPVDGMPGLCYRLREIGYRLVVISARAGLPGGLAAISRWLTNNGFPHMRVFSEKVPAALYVDDRGYRFDGDPFALEAFIGSKRSTPWNK